LEISDFEERQIKEFVRKWYQDQPSTYELFFNDFIRAENKDIRELACIPLLLALLCLIFDTERTFPKRRVDLYGEAINALLKKWDDSRGVYRDEIYRSLSIERKNRLFSFLAYETFKINELVFPQEFIIKLIRDYFSHTLSEIELLDIDFDEVFKGIIARHGIFIEQAKNEYSFSHLSFQEYFVAKYLIYNEDKGTIKNLIEKHITKTRWREIFILTFSMLMYRDDLFKQITNKLFSIIEGKQAIIQLLEKANRSTTKISNVPFVNRSAYINTALNLAEEVYWEKVQELEKRSTTTGIELIAKVDREISRARNNALKIIEHILPDATQENIVTRTFLGDKRFYFVTDYQEALPEIITLTKGYVTITCFADYLQATELTVACLEVSKVKNRTLIDEQLLSQASNE
jgi:hypothetical protein